MFVFFTLITYTDVGVYNNAWGKRVETDHKHLICSLLDGSTVASAYSTVGQSRKCQMTSHNFLKIPNDITQFQKKLSKAVRTFQNGKALNPFWVPISNAKNSNSCK